MADTGTSPHKGSASDPAGMASMDAGPEQSPGGSSQPEAAAGKVPVATLLRRLVDEVTTLVRTEAALAASEISRSIDDARQGVTSLLSGGAVLYAGVLFLLLAATLGLAQILPAWAAALIVGGVMFIVGLVMFKAGKRKVASRSFVPHRAAGAVREDADLIKRQAHDKDK